MENSLSGMKKLEDKIFLKMIEEAMYNRMTEEQIRAYKMLPISITNMVSKNGMKWTVRDYG